jgi:DNA-binding response OmpR family regulator
MDYTSLSPVLIVEDDRKTVALISLYLRREGFKTIVAHDGQQALELAQQCQPSFVVFDLMLPRLDGWEVCRRLRRTSDVPILILTAREEELDRIVGLSIGADDYVVKPFSPREVVARVKAILRRAQRTVAASKEGVVHRGLVLDLAKRKVTLHGQPIPGGRLPRRISPSSSSAFIGGRSLAPASSEGQASAWQSSRS